MSIPDIGKIKVLGDIEKTYLRIRSIENLHLSPEVHLLNLFE